MAKSRNPSVWIERRRTKSGEFKYRIRAEVDGRRLPAGPWMPKKTWADEEAAKLKARLWAGEREVMQRRRQMTWDAFAELYMQHSETSKHRRTYLWQDRPAVESFSKGAKGFALSSITPQMILEWIIALKKAGYNDTTRKMRFGALNTAFNYAVKTKLLAENPMRHVTRPTYDEGGRALTDDEITSLFTHGTEKLWRAGTFSLNTGLRVSEVMSLDWANVEVIVTADEPPIPLSQALAKLQLKQVKSGTWIGRIPARLRKTRRTVKKDCRFPINEQAKDVMGDLRPMGRVFPYAQSTIQHDLTVARRSAKLPEDITFHCFRHTFATRYLARGGHIEDMLETKLWSTYEALLRYVHVKDDVLAKRFAQLSLPVVLPPQWPEERAPRTS